LECTTAVRSPIQWRICVTVIPGVVCLLVQQKDVEAGEGALCSKENYGFEVL